MKIALKMTFGLIAVLFLGLFVLTSWACTSYGRSDAGKDQPDAQAAYEEAPKIMNEAPVPEGWPALTPANQIRVKHYPAYRAAIVTTDQDNGGSDNGMFRPLFNHISRQDIAMTAPVEMTYSDDGQQNMMAFLYRTPDMGSLGKDASDPRVEVRDVPAQTALSIGLFGIYTHKRFTKSVELLEAWLDENADEWQAAGEPRYLGYNSPFVPPFMRYGEVQVPIQPVE